jgi:septal ring-binding cell division protein DamX
MELKFESCSAKQYKRQQSFCLNKYYNKTVTSPFFLTRQTANLMEDFTRELKAGAALFLLYGESGVGKTRLLQELGRNRLAHSRIHWLDLSEGSTSDDSLQDSSKEVETIFAGAQRGDIIIADHFEKALKKTHHQLFLSWSTDGVDKRLNLIVASSTEGFNELRQLSQQYQVRVQSFQQLPFSDDEVGAFVAFYLFPDQTAGKLSIPATLRKQLAATRGVVGKIIDILKRDGALIKSSPTTDSASIRQGSKIIAMVLILFVLVVGVGWYYLGNRSALVEPVPGLASTESEPTAIVEPPVETELVAEPEVIVEPGVEPPSEVVTQRETEVNDQQLVESEPGSKPATPLETGIETAPEANSASAAVTRDTVKAEAGTAPDTEAVLVEAETSMQQETTPTGTAAISGNQTQAEPASTSRFQHDLKKSLDWITGKAESVGTMQILVLRFKTFDETVYYEYVESLANQQVDTSQLKVFKTLSGDTEYYSVFYGEYASWQDAKKAKGSLPEVLRKTAPIARSVGGIMKEIRRLETES